MGTAVTEQIRWTAGGYYWTTGWNAELAHNAAAGMRKVSRVRREMATYAPDEIGKVLRTADKDRNGHLWYLALSGLRRGEIAD